MAQKTLDAVIRLMGQQMPSFTQLGTSIQSLGSQIDQIGAKVRQFEKESVNIYRDYEDRMLGVKGVLRDQYDSMTLFSRDMRQLDQYARVWASTTIFHTNDVAAAIEDAAHAGWTFDEMVQGIPQAMLLAQAGGLDLADAMEYLVPIMKTTHTEFGDMGTMIDQWVKSANASATTVEGMGETFTALSASALFGDSTQELFTMAAVMANAGITGSTAGTMMRNVMLRLVAPTKQASDAMDLLGISAEELSEEDLAGFEDQIDYLNELGFSAYDAEGNLLPMIDIFKNLHAVLPQGEQERYDILKKIFPMRSISGALAILDAIDNGSIDELFTNIGDSEGYAASVADTMMSGLTGSIETLLSKWEEFKNKVGETLAPFIERLADALGSLVDWLNGLDEPTLTALVGGMTALATLGPGLIVVGGAMKIFGTLGPVGLTMVGLAIGAGVLAGALSKLNEIEFNSHFGDLELDLDELGAHVDGLGTKFSREYGQISAFEGALEDATGKYSDLVTRLNETLLTDVLTGKTLTPDEQGLLYSYADDIYKALTDGIALAKGTDMSFLELLFGDQESAEQIEAGNTAAQVVDSYYEGLYAEAYTIGEELRRQFTLALTDGVLDENERMAIQATIDRYNQIEAEIQDRMSREAFLEQLFDAQHLSAEGIKPFFEENLQKQQEELDAIDTLYRGKWAHYRAAYEDAIANGLTYYTVDGEQRAVSEADWALFEAQLNDEWQRARQSTYDKYGAVNAAAMQTLFDDSTVSEAWRLLSSLSVDENGGWSFTNDSAAILNGMTSAELRQVATDLGWIFSNRNEFGKYLGNDATSNYYKGLMEVADYASELLMGSADILDSQTEAQRQDIEERQLYLDRLLNGYDQDVRTVETPYQERGLFDYGLSLSEYQEKQAQAQGRIDEIERVRAEIDGMTEQMNNLPPFDMTVVAELDTSAVDAYTPPTKTMNVVPHNYVSLDLFAEGGRATQPSIFGDAGAEWAIPEEHSIRTADLLNAARAASGFTWGDLMSRYGGLGGGGQTMTVNYAPVINAGDATGVAGALAADKDRLMRMIRSAIENQKFRDSIEVYA